VGNNTGPAKRHYTRILSDNYTRILSDNARVYGYHNGKKLASKVRGSGRPAPKSEGVVAGKINLKG
jgi:hypothetical protein